MKQLIALLDCCADCPSAWQNASLDYWCSYEDIAGNLYERQFIGPADEAENGYPDWCPLDDYEEVENGS